MGRAIESPEVGGLHHLCVREKAFVAWREVADREALGVFRRARRGRACYEWMFERFSLWFSPVKVTLLLVSAGSGNNETSAFSEPPSGATGKQADELRSYSLSDGWSRGCGSRPFPGLGTGRRGAGGPAPLPTRDGPARAERCGGGRVMRDVSPGRGPRPLHVAVRRLS